jgi:prepilin-type N-terminal cleavage/methylation domain-containing protein
MENQKVKKNENGFTMIEILVAMVILVIAFGLVTALYVRAARIRKVVVASSEIQQVLSQMNDVLIYGTKGKWGLSDASGISDASGLNTIVAYNETEAETMIARIDTEKNLTGSGQEINTLWVNWYDNPVMPTPFYTAEALVDVNYNIELSSGSVFGFYNGRGIDVLLSDRTETTFIKIKLQGLSTTPGMEEKTPGEIVTGVRLLNKIPF